MSTDFYHLLRCPRCGASPRRREPSCPGCGRPVLSANGGLDLLDDTSREAADRFANQYAALRRREGWLGPDGREDPDSGDRRLWRQRLESLAEARTALASRLTRGQRPLLVDIGSGGGWASRHLGDADVIALDLIDVASGAGPLQVRGDMRRLPLCDGCADAALYVASLHYAPLTEAIPEAARVLRPGGVMVAVDSPMYRDRREQARARQRSAAYYAGAGFPELAAHYHPIAMPDLKSELETAGFEVLGLDGGSTAGRWYERAGRRRPSFLLARTKPS